MDRTQNDVDKDGFMAQVAGVLSDVEKDHSSISSFAHSASTKPREEKKSPNSKHPERTGGSPSRTEGKDAANSAATNDALPLSMLCNMVSLQQLWLDALNCTLAAITAHTTTGRTNSDASTAEMKTSKPAASGTDGASAVERKYSRTASAPLSTSSQLKHNESTTSATQASKRPTSPATAGAATPVASPAEIGTSIQTSKALSDMAAVYALDQCLVIMLEEAYVLAVATLNALASALQHRHRNLSGQESLEAPSSSGTAPGSGAEAFDRTAMFGAAVLKDKQLSSALSPSTSTESFPMTPSTSSESLAANTSSTRPNPDGNNHMAVQSHIMDLDGCYNTFFALLPALRTAVEETAQRSHVRLMLGAWHPHLPHGGNGPSSTMPTTNPTIDSTMTDENVQQQNDEQQMRNRGNSEVLDQHTGRLSWNPRSKPALGVMSSLSSSLPGISTPVPEHGTSFDTSDNLEPPSPVRRPSGLKRSISRKPSLSHMPLPPSPFKAIALTSDDVFVPSHDLMVASHDPRHHRPPRAPSFRVNNDSEIVKASSSTDSSVALTAKPPIESPFGPPMTSATSTRSLEGLSLWSFDGLPSADFGHLNNDCEATSAAKMSSLGENREHSSSSTSSNDVLRQDLMDRINQDHSENEPRGLLRPPSFKNEKTTTLLRPPSFNIGTPASGTTISASIQFSNETPTSSSSDLSASAATYPPTSLFSMLSVGSDEDDLGNSEASDEGVVVSGFDDTSPIKFAGALPVPAAGSDPPPVPQEPPLGMSWAPDGVLAAQSWRTEAMDSEGRQALGKCLGAFWEWNLDLLADHDDGNRSSSNSSSSSSSSSSSHPSDRLRVSHAIGRGGCASVYLAHLAFPFAACTASTRSLEISTIGVDETAPATEGRVASKQWIGVALKKLEIPAGVPQAQLSRSILDFHAEASILHRLRFTPSGTTK